MREGFCLLAPLLAPLSLGLGLYSWMLSEARSPAQCAGDSRPQAGRPSLPVSYGPSAALAMRGYTPVSNVGIRGGLALGSSGPMVLVPRAQPQAPIGLTTAGEQLVNRNRPRNQAAINQMERLHNRGAGSAPNLDFRVLNGNNPAIKPKDCKVRFADSPGNTDAKTARKGVFGEGGARGSRDPPLRRWGRRS